MPWVERGWPVAMVVHKGRRADRAFGFKKGTLSLVDERLEVRKLPALHHWVEKVPSQTVHANDNKSFFLTRMKVLGRWPSWFVR